MGVVCTVRQTQAEGDAGRWSQTAGQEGFEVIVAVGGDGTVAEAAGGLVHAPVKVPLAHVPVGSANVIAIALSLPWMTRSAADVIKEGHVRSFDVGYLPDVNRHFLLMAAIGFPARIIKDSSRKWKNLIGVFAYLGAGLRNLFAPGHARLEISTEYAPLTLKAHTVLITNIGRIRQFGFKVAPGTSPHDGKFDVSIFSSRTLWDVIKIFLRLITWRQRTGAMRNFRAEHVHVNADPPLPVQIDGEIVGMTPVTAEVIHGQIEIVVPSGYR
jgi:YegS/Rv2252/BmrU family lipid kinase